MVRDRGQNRGRLAGARGRGRGRGRGGRALPPPVVEPRPDPRRQRYERFLAVRHKEPMWIDTIFLRDCGFLGRFRELLNQAGWPGLLELEGPTNVEDTCEFLTSFHYRGPADDQGFTYRFRGFDRECSMAQLRAVFGWPAVDVAEVGALSDPSDIVETGRLLGVRYLDPSETSARSFDSPFWYYVHFVMTRILTARANGNDKPTVRDCALLGALIRGRVPHWGHFFCQHLDSAQPRGPECIGGMVTYLLRRLHPELGDLPEHRIVYFGRADRERLKSGRNIRITARGEIQWIYFRDPERLPDISPPRGRGRPAGVGAGRRRDRDEFEPLNVVPPEDELPHQPPPQPQSGYVPQDNISYVFNLTRYSAMMMRGIYHVPPVPPPEGWQPGDAIPPEYMQPPPPPPYH